MALYAFDGTWNSDEDKDVMDTNVVRFCELYQGEPKPPEYISGVGTRFGPVGRVLGGIFGSGGKTRIKEMSERLAANWENDQTVDVIGFSRGAALAVHFANTIGEDGVELSNGEIIKPKVRFLGVWDIVGSFGLSFDTPLINFQDINLGWNIDYIGKNVGKCSHAMALDERRETFNVTRLDPDNEFDNIEEQWFRGVHSDIGGGNENPDRSNIALQWMIGEAIKSGVPIDQAKARGDKYKKIDLMAKISENTDIQIDPRRKVKKGDKKHFTAEPKHLKVGEQHTFTILAELKFNWSGVYLEEGATYNISTSVGDTWSDDEIECGPSGWTSDRLPWLKGKMVGLFEGKRRLPEANWFELVGAYGDEDDHLFRLGQAEGGQDYKATQSEELYLFANDLNSKYDNNSGDLKVTIKRIA